MLMRSELEQRLAAYSFDAPDCQNPFSLRVARENAWSVSHALRVIDEYRRFVLLALLSPHPVTPSDAVDQVWHLHLTYTEEYWGTFCGEVLGRPLHHTPSRGGPAERRKYVRDYERTLEAYARAFGTAPPSDIWPDSARRFGLDLQFARVNLGDNWVLPKPTRLLSSLARGREGLLFGLLAFGLGGCATIGNVPPFDLKGSHFLVFYCLLWTLTLILARRADREQEAPPEPLPELDAYDAAYLNGGAAAAVGVAAASLVSSGAIALDAQTRVLSAGKFPERMHAFERVLHDRTAANPVTGPVLQTQSREMTAELARSLIERRLLYPSSPLAPFLLALIAPLAGVLKIGVGISRDKPVGFLVVLCVIGFAVAFARFLPREKPTPLGARLLSNLKERQGELRKLASSSMLDGATLPLAVALLGPSVLSGEVLDSVSGFFGQGSSSSGADGGCSGGGGCGGGCGGCGGCG